MSSEYQIILYNQFGTVDQTVISDSYSIDYVRNVNSIGYASISIPIKYDKFIISGKDIIPDLRVSIKRRVGSGSFYDDMETQWIVRKMERHLNERGNDYTILGLKDANDLLGRRIVAYASGSAQAEKTDFADDMCKDIVRENLGSNATDTSRSIAPYLTIQSDLGLAAIVGKSFSRRNVLRVLQELALSSFQAGTYLAFDIVSISPTQLEFRTFINQRGVDHRWPSSTNPLLFGSEFGNLVDVVRGYDHTEEVTYGYAGGQGQGTSRSIGTSSDSTRIGQSPFGRSESFIDARQTNSPTLLADEADSLVRNGIPRNYFQGRIIDTPQATYGLHYKFGDYVTAVFKGEKIDCRIEQVRVQVKDGVETITTNILGNYS